MRKVYSPNSIWHGSDIGRHSKEALLRLELERLKDFVDYLFEQSEHCDHISYSDAWKEFEIYEAKNSFMADEVRKKRAKLRG